MPTSGKGSPDGTDASQLEARLLLSGLLPRQKLVPRSLNLQTECSVTILSCSVARSWEGLSVQTRTKVR